MRRLRVTPVAKSDLRGIWAYIADDNPRAADRFLRRLYGRMLRLPRYPEIGERYDQYRPGLRGIVEGSYVIFYEITPDAVHIFRVLHGARNWEAILAE